MKKHRIKKIKRINQLIGAIWGIKKYYFVIILVWQTNVIFLTNFFIRSKR